jgi:hypothetical protein
MVHHHAGSSARAVMAMNCNHDYHEVRSSNKKGHEMSRMMVTVDG